MVGTSCVATAVVAPLSEKADPAVAIPTGALRVGVVRLLVLLDLDIPDIGLPACSTAVHAALVAVIGHATS